MEAAKNYKVKVTRIKAWPSMLEWGLKEITKRYFSPGITFKVGGNTPASSTSHIGHFADCQIFRSLQQYDFCFCSCGLLHDLEKRLADNPELIEIIYPQYSRDYRLQERGEDEDEETSSAKATREAEEKECRRILIETFGPPASTTLTEIKKQHESNKKLLNKVFKGAFVFPAALRRLDEKLAKDIEEYREHEAYRAAASSAS